jgi:hypothetical protein
MELTLPSGRKTKRGTGGFCWIPVIAEYKTRIKKKIRYSY